MSNFRRTYPTRTFKDWSNIEGSTVRGRAERYGYQHIYNQLNNTLAQLQANPSDERLLAQLYGLLEFMIGEIYSTAKLGNLYKTQKAVTQLTDYAKHYFGKQRANEMVRNAKRQMATKGEYPLLEHYAGVEFKQEPVFQPEHAEEGENEEDLQFTPNPIYGMRESFGRQRRRFDDEGLQSPAKAYNEREIDDWLDVYYFHKGSPAAARQVYNALLAIAEDPEAPPRMRARAQHISNQLLTSQ